MKKYIYMVFLSALICACTKTIEIIDPYSPGTCIGMMELQATSGKVSVAVETAGDWRLETEQDWLKFDTKGRSGNGSFTVYYESNESDVMTTRSGRIGKVAIRLADSLRTDTLVIIQQGMYPVEADFNVVDDPAIVLEYDLGEKSDVTLLCCSSEGEGDVQALLDAHQADIVILDGEVSGEVEGLNVRGCDYAGMTIEEKYLAFKNLVELNYNSGLDAGDDWIFAGQMYHFSVMQYGYESTPTWYPVEKDAVEFKADMYAWQNNLYDCVWMYQRNYVETYVDADGRSYSADYVYASSSAFAKITSVELLDVKSLSHKVIKITLKH